MENEKLYLVYIPVPEYISDKIHQMNLLVTDRFENNSYSSFYKGKWESHIMLYLSPMACSRQGDIIREVELLSKKFKKFKIILDDFEEASGNYLFIGVRDEPTDTIKYFHDELVNAMLPFRDSSIKEKYLQMWDTYSVEEQNRIKTTGIPYEYVPHTSVASLSSESEVAEAKSMLKDKSLEGLEFEADKLDIMISGVNDYTNKEIIASFDLN